MSLLKRLTNVARGKLAVATRSPADPLPESELAALQDELEAPRPRPDSAADPALASAARTIEPVPRTDLFGHAKPPSNDDDSPPKRSL